MIIKFYDSLTRSVREFEPPTPQHVTMYVCGITAYDTPHLGNARPAVVFDVLYRLLRHEYGADNVEYARNITDIDDKIINRAREEGIPIDALTERTTAEYHEICQQLGLLPPDQEPRATGHIYHMVRMIERLIDKGFAYVADGHVLFDIEQYPRHGVLSRHLQENLDAGHRVEVAAYKRNPGDFVLWKPSSDDQPGWLSKWGRGRPGWHIECSAMIEYVLGTTIDIHGGGGDLRFPHHDAEISQSACAHDGAPLARYWMHNGMVTVDGKKMAKSENNFVTVRDAMADAHGEAIRFALLLTHYRSPLDWTRRRLLDANMTLNGWYRKLRELNADGSLAPASNAYADGVIRALCDDLNTPQAVTELHRLFGLLEDENCADMNRMIASGILFAGSLLGIFQRKEGLKPEEPDAAVEALIARRTEAKARKDFKEADAIRAQLNAMGVVVEDTKNGVRWHRSFIDNRR